MLTSRSKNQNLSQMQAGQSLFDFLKRKKKFALETSLSKSRQKQNNSTNSNMNSIFNTTNPKDKSQYKANQSKKQVKVEVSPRKKYQNTYRQTLRQTVDLSNLGRYQDTYRSAGQQQAITPRKVSFGDDRQKKLTSRNSFIQMISPLNRKNATSKTPDHHTAKEVSIQKEIDRPKPTSNPHQHFYRRNLNSSIQTLKSALQKFITLSSTLKQKSHSIFIQLKPLLKLIQQSDNPNFAKRAQDAKIKLRTFQHLFKQFNIENGNQIIEQFHRTLSQHLVSYESNLKANVQKQRNQWLNRIKNDKDCTIQDLLDRESKNLKQIQNLNKKLEKLQRQSEKLKYNSDSTIQRGEVNSSAKIQSLQNKIKQYQMQINNLAKQLDSAKQAEKTLHKQVKDLKYLKQQAQKRFIEQNIKIKSSKQEFLLNQISILKKQFKSDMEQLTQLYSTKQKQNIRVIEELSCQLSELQKLRSQDKEVQSKIVGDAITSKTQIQKYKKRYQCIVTDLHRMNEELYQHWLALKDLKTLSVRLQIYNKFAKIYEDLNFNDQLFI